MIECDLLVIGSGPAGKRAAIQAAKWGKNVYVVEKHKAVGGVTVHTGTIPSKTLRETVLNLSGWRERAFYGRSYRVKEEITAADLKQRMDLTLSQEVDTLEHQFNRNKVHITYGCASFVDPHVVEVEASDGEKQQYKAHRVLIATGTHPFRPEYIPFDGERVLDSDEILDIDDVPKSLCVIGAGVIGVEYATIFSALDVNVTLVEPRNSMLDFVDRELIEDFTHQLRDRGMNLRFGQKVTKVSREGNTCFVELENKRVIRCDMVLFAAGRMGNTGSLNLDKAGLSSDHRGRLTIRDKDTFQTEVDHIYAAGDVIGFPSLASTSMEQGRIAAFHAFERDDVYDAPEYFPYGIYSVPEMSTCGMSEEEVQERGIAYECGICRFRETSRGQIMGLEDGMMKLIFSMKTRRLLGCHIVGEGATELIHIGQAVLNLKGTMEYFVENTFNYPTLAEAYKVAALDAWNRMPPLGSD
ncbi:Si-specific NAD(P)(+) transhydrogenase [Aestuariispira insulae]|uniref:Soluble pyridine nucleotide transhydrogenase n=1 Tax=Aestuariispira insulae TaxID=1461337 RepID=A0A3D9HW29_9PROT|nr:Si-specific NAD(P)(+) transhydrogenase [Aestuariispira insulae]RED53630.1 pyruvate/2-oxoglutarate dehydrogenase complex dihydrolipoamide dehydrogenase (E3) component [Aestuariispira insulae]